MLHSDISSHCYLPFVCIEKTNAWKHHDIFSLLACLYVSLYTCIQGITKNISLMDNDVVKFNLIKVKLVLLKHNPFIMNIKNDYGF